MPAAGPRQSGKQGVVLFSPSMILSLARAGSLLDSFPVYQFRRTTGKRDVVIREGGGKV